MRHSVFKATHRIVTTVGGQRVCYDVMLHRDGDAPRDRETPTTSLIRYDGAWRWRSGVPISGIIIRLDGGLRAEAEAFPDILRRLQ